MIKNYSKKLKYKFLYVNSSQIYSKYFGEAEESIRNLFSEARKYSPSIIFFDEIDGLVGKRFFFFNF